MALKDINKVIDLEVAAIQSMKYALNEKEVDSLVYMIANCKGKIVFMGIGKSGQIAQKSASTFSSLGISSIFVHPTDAAHGDLGMISNEDVVIILSKSGETDELLKIFPSLKILVRNIVLISSKRDSTIASMCSLNICIGVTEEACVINMAPTSSTTSMLVLLDAIAVTVSSYFGIKPENFGLLHPSGVLGKKALLRVDDIMHNKEAVSFLNENSTIGEVIIGMTKNPIGCVCIINEYGELVGLITDGDLRRGIEKYKSIEEISVSSILTENPITINTNLLAVEALNIMKSYQRVLTVLPRVDENNKVIGVISLTKLISERIL